MALDTSVIIDNPVDAAIQELDLLLGTDLGELLGEQSFGANLEQYLWTLTPNVNEVKKYIQKKINNYTYWCKELNITIDVNTVQGTVRDIYEIQIKLEIPAEFGGGTVKTKKYVFS